MSTTKTLPSIKLLKEDEEKLIKLDYKFDKPFSSGEYGVVYKVIRPNHTPNECAAKVIDISKIDSSQAERDMQREIFMMNRIKHPYVVEVLDIIRIQPNSVIIFIELCYGDLCDLISEKGWLDEPLARIYYSQIGSALMFIHDIGYAHRDMKLENVLLNADRTVTKLTDFGFARNLYDPNSGKRVMAKTWCGTVAYMPPEILNLKHDYCPMKADVWSTGVLLFTLLNDDFPWGDSDHKWMVQQQKERKYRYFNNSLSESVKKLIDLHFEPDPDNRATFRRLLKHSWVTQRRSSLTTLSFSLSSEFEPTTLSD